MSNKHWLVCRGNERGAFYGATAPPTGLMGKNSKVAELNRLSLSLSLSLSLLPPPLFPGQRLRGNYSLMGQLMSPAVSPCTQQSGPKLVKWWFLHIFVLFIHLCYKSNLSVFFVVTGFVFDLISSNHLHVSSDFFTLILSVHRLCFQMPLWTTGKDRGV